MKVPEILNNINLDETQIAALDTFFKEWTEDIKTATKAELVAEGADMISRADAQKAFELYEADAEKAFALYEGDTEKAFEFAKRDWQKEFDAILEEKENKYTESLTMAIQDIYEEVENKVKEDFKHSPEYQALQRVKDIMIPMVISEDQKEILAKLEQVVEKEKVLEESQKALSKDQVIATLLQDFPREYAETVKNFISKAKDEEEVYERFNTIVEMIDKGAVKTKDNGAPEVVTESTVVVPEAQKVIFKRKIQQAKQASKATQAMKPVLESATGKDRKPEVKVEDKFKKLGLSDFEEQVLRMAFPQSI